MPVDAVVSTIGFPLVGGPAGTMEGGRQADVAKGILTAKNIPYIIAAPLLIQVSVCSSSKPKTPMKRLFSSLVLHRQAVSLTLSLF